MDIYLFFKEAVVVPLRNFKEAVVTLRNFKEVVVVTLWNFKEAVVVTLRNYSIARPNELLRNYFVKSIGISGSNTKFQQIYKQQF
jgi:hypothetical protein